MVRARISAIRTALPWSSSIAQPTPGTGKISGSTIAAVKAL
jgi:hypothetical protein